MPVAGTDLAAAPPPPAPEPAPTVSEPAAGATTHPEPPAQPEPPAPPERRAEPPPPPEPGTGHVFISYKSEDRHRARVVAEALERRGWPVWWDRDIQAGQAYRRVIAQALEEAACVVALWSTLSVESDWVLEEAQDAQARNILVPALLDEVRPPLGFGQTQAADLVGWDGDPAAAELDDLLRGVATLMGFADVPPLLDDEAWAAIAESARQQRAAAAAAQATEERAAAEAAREEAERAAVAREAASRAGEHEAEAAAARQEREAQAAEEAARQAAEEREAGMAAALAEQHAAELRAAAARRAALEAEVERAEDAARRVAEQREADRVAAEQEAAARAAERAASLRAAEEAALAAEEVAERATALRAESARPDRRRRDDDVARASWFRFPNEGVATLIGAGLVAVAAVLPWTNADNNPFVPGDTPMDHAFSTLLEGFEVVHDSSLGIFLLAVAALGGLLAVFRIPRWITVLLGAAAVFAAVAFLIQVVRLIDTEGSVDTFFELVNVGPAVALVGGVLMLSGR